MFQPKTAAAAAVCAALLSFAPDADAQHRYRWVDENGAIRIADRIPPDAAGKRIEVLNQRGMVIRVIAAEPTAAERAEAERIADAEASAELAAQEQARRDRMLLDSYLSVDDLTRARDTRLSSLEAQITVSRDAAENLQRTVDDLAARVAQAEAAGEPVPAPLAQRLASMREQLDATQRFLEAREQEQADIRTQFDTDIARFRQLRGGG